MKRFVWILVGALILAPPGLALKDKPASPEPDARRTELSNELSAFVREAVNEGLLDPVGTARKQHEAEVAPGPTQLIAEPAAPLVPEPMPSGPINCAAPYPLDFKSFEGLSRYSDIYAYREGSPLAGTEIVPVAAKQGEAHPGVTLAKAYIALDLASEAAMTVKSGRGQDEVALQNLATLLDGYGPAPTAYFAELAACYPQAGLWHALALVSHQDKSGSALLEANLSGFRQLPVQLRDRAAMIAVPALDGTGHRTLAKLLLGSFSEEEIAGSNQLRFSEAIIDLGEGSPEAEQLIGQFLIHSRFQEAALSALVRHKRPVEGAMREILVDEMFTRIELAQKDADVREDLSFVLDEMSAGSLYEPMMKLAELPSMQSPEARAELTRNLADSLKRDLESDDSLRNLAAIEALVKEPGLLDAMPERAALYELGTEVAVRLGFGSLGEVLSDKAQGGEGVAEQRAVLAYRQKDMTEVFGLASRYPANQKINLIAAQAAIDTLDRAKLSVLEPRLTLAPETILTLIELDAATGHWMVSDKVFEAASRLTGEAEQTRVARVMNLKQTPVATVPATVRVPMSSIPGILSRSRESLEKMPGEAP